MLVQRLKNITPSATLIEPEIPDRTQPTLPSGEWGINLAAAQGVFPDKGLQVHITAWSLMGKGDKVELLLNGNPVDQHSISENTEVGQRSTLFVAPRHLQTGSYTLSYRVTRLNQVPETQTPPLRIYVKLEIPGGQDTNPEPGQHSNLFMYIDPKIVNGIVDKETAERGVPIIVRAKSGTGVPYPDAAVGDVISLSWGGVFQESASLTAQQISDPANHPIDIRVTESTILEAGDTDGSGLAVTFRVRDKVNNYSEDWCKETRIKVSTGTDLLVAPIVREALNNVLDLDKLGDKDITGQVWASLLQFKLGDIIILKMRGTTVDGDVVEVSAPPQTVNNLPHTYEFTLLNGDVRKLAKTQVTFSYRVERPGTLDPLPSKGQFVTFIGEPERLAAPIAEDEQNGAIDPDLPRTRIRIPFDLLIEVGMAIELKWFGTRPDSSTYDPALEWFFPDREEVKGDFFITVEGKHLKILEGGTLDLSYNLLSDEDGIIVSRGSRPASPLRVGEPQFELAKPIVLGEKDGALEPSDLPNGASRLTASRPTVVPTKKDDVVTYTWLGEETGKKEDSVELNGLSQDKDVNFTLDAAFVAAHIEPNRGKKVTVSYRIWRAETNEFSYSNPMAMQIGLRHLAAPIAVDADHGAIEPDLPRTRIQIPFDEIMEENMDIQLKWFGVRADLSAYDPDLPRYRLSLEEVEAKEDLFFTVDGGHLKTLKDGTLDLSYNLLRDESGEIVRRESLHAALLIVGEAQFELDKPIVLGEQDGTLEPDDLPDGLGKLTAPRSTGKPTEENDVVTYTWKGEVTGKTEASITLDTLSKDKEVIFGLSAAFVAEHIEPNRGKKVTVSYRIWRAETDKTSYSFPIEVQIGVQQLIVIGHRSQVGPHYHGNLSRLTASTDVRAQVLWTYAGDSDGLSGESFLDTEPERALIVTLENESKVLSRQVLRPSNVSGVFNLDSRHSGCIVKDDGAVFGWSDNVEMLPPPSAVNVSCITAGGQAFAALKKDATVIAWGAKAFGGAIEPEIEAQLKNVKKLASSAGAFLALRDDGSLLAWGAPDFGGKIPTAVISQLTPALQIIGNTVDFSVLLLDGRVLSWGGTWPEGLLVSQANGATRLCASDRAFSALKADRSVVAWGSDAHGGTIPAHLPSSLTNVSFLASSSAAFAALKVDGSVIAWGNSRFGGETPGNLRNVTHVVGSTTAFCALRDDGSLTAWGDPDEGAEVPDRLGAVLSLSASYGSFSAVLEDFTSISWGVNATDAIQMPVVCVYSAGPYLVALGEQKTLRAWGPNALDLEPLTGKVSYTE